MRINAMITRW